MTSTTTDHGQPALEPVNDWKRRRSSTTNAARLGRPPTSKEIAAQKWRAKNLTSVKTTTASPEGADVDVTGVSLQFLEAWNEYCANMEALNEHVYRAMFKNSVEAGKRARAALKKQKKLIAVMNRASLLFEQHLERKRKSEKQKKSSAAKGQNTSRRRFALQKTDNVTDADRREDEELPTEPIG